MKRNPLILLAATLAAPAVALAQSTRPAPVLLDATFADGSTQRRFNLTPSEIAWVNAAFPVPTPVTPPATAPALDPRGVYIGPADSWPAAVKACPSGKIVYLPPGSTYEGPGLVSTDGKLAPGISIATWGSPAATIIVPEGSAILLWKQNGFGIYNLNIKARKATKTLVDFVDCNAITIDKGDISGGRWGIGNDVKSNKRSVGFTVSNSKIHNNAFKGGDSHGGWFGSTDGLVVKGCYFESNGDTTSGADVAARCHHLYVEGKCGPATVTDNYFARCAGIAVQMRSGGDFLRNTCVDNPVHLSFGLVNGAGPLVVGGVSGTVKNNSFVGTKAVGKTWLGYATEFSNILNAEVSNNAFATDVVVDPKLGTFPYAVKVDKSKPADGNPYKGKEVIVAGRLVFQDNAINWNGLDVWVNPAIPKAVTARVTKQAAFPAVDVAAERAKATARSLTAAN